MVVALVGNNYHFVGDCVAGGFLGSIGGAWTAHFLGLRAVRNENRIPKMRTENKRAYKPD